MQIDTLRERFAQPPAEFGPTPFWFLNDDLDEERLSSALAEMRSKGIAGVIIHPRTGMEIEYLSERFWERLRFICDTLKRLRLKGWLYDEYNWPSGPVGGKLLREHPEFKQRGIDYRMVSPSAARTLSRQPPGEILAAFALSGTGISDRTEQFRKGETEAFAGERALVFFAIEVREPFAATHGAAWTKGETGYLDVLNAAAVQRFMELTHSEYDRHLRQYYGSPLVGVFTDEPANYFGLPYTGSLPAEFRRRFDREFRSALPALVSQLPGLPLEQGIRDRTNYFETVRDLYVNSFFRKISEWASERGLIFTGHVNDDDDIGRLPATNVSFYAPLSQMHMPGTDILSDAHGYDTDHPALIHANFNPKALSSAAHHCGAGRTLCEIWGGNGWATSPEKLKSVLNWAQGCGVNFVNPHAAFMSLKGHRKRDFPASHFAPQPWWRFYKTFSEYIARLSLLNSAGVHVADILFAFPVKSLWAAFDLKKKNNKLADFLETVSLALLRHQLDFDYLFDEVVDSGKVEIDGERLVVGEESYRLLLLPLSPVFPRKLLELAERFATGGGKILALGYEMPTHDEYGGEISLRIESLFGEKQRSWVAHRQLSADPNSDSNWLVKKINEFVKRDLVADGPLARNLMYLHRKSGNIHSYFVGNLSEGVVQAELAFRLLCGKPQIWNPDNGSVKNMLAYRRDDEYIRTTVRFEPNQAYFFVFTDEPPVDHVDSTNLNLTTVTIDYADGYTSALEVRMSRGDKRYTRNVEQALPPIQMPERWEIDFPVRNIYLLDEWDIEILSETESTKWSPHEDPRLGMRARLLVEIARAGFALKRRLAGSIGNSKTPTTKFQPMHKMADTGEKWSKRLGIDTAQFEEAEGVLFKLAKYAGFPMGYDYPPAGSTFAMSAVFHVEHIPDDLALVYENYAGEPLSVEVNGHRMHEPPEQVFVWDHSNRAVPIAGLVREGENHVRLEWRQPEFPTLYPSVHGVEPVCLTGRFWVNKGTIVEQKYGTSALPWSQAGLPNYIGTLSYRATFDVPMTYMAQQLFLKLDRLGSAAEVKINGKNVGVILWRPYALDVTNFVVPGENSIEITVANTAANLLGEPIAAGLIGKPYIVPYWRHRIRFVD